MTESSASTPENCFIMHHGDITGIELKINGVSKHNLATKGQIHAHMNKYYVNNTGHHSHFPPGSTGYGQFQWLFYNFISCDYPNITKGNNKKINIVGGVSTKSRTLEIVLTNSATDANASLIVIIESDQFIECRLDQTIKVSD